MVSEPKLGYYSVHPEKSNEYALLLLAKSTNPSVIQKAEEQLLALNEFFLISFTKDWIPSALFASDYDDLLQDARVAFLQSVRNYDIASGVSIRYYARFYLLELKRAYFGSPRFIFDIKHLQNEGSDVRAFDIEGINIKEIINDAFQNSLNSSEAEMLSMHFFDGMKKRAIAKVRKCSEARVCTIVKQSLQKLKTYLINKGISLEDINFN